MSNLSQFYFIILLTLCNICFRHVIFNFILFLKSELTISFLKERLSSALSTLRTTLPRLSCSRKHNRAGEIGLGHKVLVWPLPPLCCNS